ncbi:MAG: FadR family transcriptional regulator [Candidatus Aminicenantes bacterium]|nr:MAG: FadR family transcriptional regulator [Candidatus Aminicenantes bacterium]
MFREAKQNRIFQDVVDQIQEAILQGRLKAGNKLPPERELIDTFKTSRGTLREALRVLEQKGLITIKTGVSGGAFVKALSIQQVSESLDLLIRYERVSLRDLAEFREGVEGIVAGLAVERVKSEDIQYLKKLLADAKTHLDEGASGWDNFIHVDNQLHMALAHIAGNPIYESVLQTVYDNIHRYFDQFLPREEELLRENYQDLCEIVKAVENGQAAQAHLLVQNHVYRFNRLMEENAKQFET